jgi:hypothetical protein
MCQSLQRLPAGYLGAHVSANVAIHSRDACPRDCKVCMNEYSGKPVKEADTVSARQEADTVSAFQANDLTFGRHPQTDTSPYVAMRASYDRRVLSACGGDGAKRTLTILGNGRTDSAITAESTWDSQS